MRRNRRPAQHRSEYNSWKAMIARCYQPSCPSYKYAGARGIEVCSRWRESFVAFLEDMGPKPTPQHSILRIRKSENYAPGNCRWATPTEQARNRPEFNHNLTFRGRTLTVAEWAEITGIDPATITSRLTLGWDPVEALSIEPEMGQRPIQKKRRPDRVMKPGSNSRNQSSGVRGVSWHSRRQLWYARIWVGGEARSLGYFPTQEAAVEAVRAAADQAEQAGEDKRSMREE